MCVGAATFAQGLPETPPLPPPRPTEYAPSGLPLQQPPLPPPSPVAPRANQAAPVQTHRPFDRAAMRACGEEWVKMKREGSTVGLVWRDFAAECIPRHQKR